MARRTFRAAHPWSLWTGQGPVGLVFPGSLLAVALAVDLLFPSQIAPPLIVAVPVLAIATAGVVGAAVFTVLSAAVCFLEAVMEGWHQTHDFFYGELIALLALYLVGLLPGYVKTRRERSMERLRSVAEAVQQAVLVPVPRRVGCLRAAADYLAADDEALIGGDLYDLVNTRFGVRMIIGDVRGKGVPAVTSANNLLGAFRAIAPDTPSLPELARRLDGIVRRHKRRAGLDVEEFITATLVSIPEGSWAQVLCCGHPGPLLIRSGNAAENAAGEATEITAVQPWLPLGLGNLTADDPRAESVPFGVGDRLLLHTDGVTEARDTTGRFYPLYERAATWTSAGPEQLVQALVGDLKKHTHGRLTDDAALLAAQRVDQAVDP